MKTTVTHKGNMIAIIAMFFLFAMISFVTNLAAPFGAIWRGSYHWSGMLGNMMNFLAYLFMGIPAGNLLVRFGYKKNGFARYGGGACRSYFAIHVEPCRS